ncbi:hypothetical protein ABZ848_46935 [Streptomyces sp. NPDC047081]|uniref:hypothetical protein n=1 Tax=Streptomyces sp. NPDC047081 TaxID=3154706 RepID=UPI00340F52CF
MARIVTLGAALGGPQTALLLGAERTNAIAPEPGLRGQLRADDARFDTLAEAAGVRVW